MQKLSVPVSQAGRRLDKYLMKYFDAAPKSFLYKAFRKKNIRLDGKRADGSEILKGGEEISLFFSDETIASLRSGAPGKTEAARPAAGAAKKPLESFCGLLYEDENLILANKRSGVKSQKAQPEDYSLNEALLDYCGGAADGGAFVPSVCNRLDRNTSGLVLFAKTYGASRVIGEMLRSRTVRKYYIAAVSGKVLRAEHLHAWIRKDESTNKVSVSERELAGASHIETAFAPLSGEELSLLGLKSAHGNLDGAEYTLLKIELITGKTHQIRAHLAHTGHAVLGDVKYGDPSLCRALKSKYHISSQLLHAWELQMPDPAAAPLQALSGRVFRAELPESFGLFR